MAINNSAVAIGAPELAGTMTASFTLLGTFVEAPVIVIFDNQSTTSSGAISFDGGLTTWHTFPAGEALVLDLRANLGLAPNLSFGKGIPVYVLGAGGGTFSVSYVYAKNQ